MYMFINSDENEIHLKTKKSKPVYWDVYVSDERVQGHFIVISCVNIDQPMFFCGGGCVRGRYPTLITT